MVSWHWFRVFFPLAESRTYKQLVSKKLIA